MQTHGGEAAARAIELAKERHFINDVVVDWHGTGDAYPTGAMTDLSPFIEEISVNRGLEGSVPEELSIVEGSAAAELSLTLSGTDPVSGLSMVEIFSEFNTRSPLHGLDLIGAEITWAIWVETDEGPKRYQQFIGLVREVSPNRAEGTVEITALDRAELLRQPVTFPNWAYSLAAANDGRFAGQQQNTQGPMDMALRTAGVSPTPYYPHPELHTWYDPSPTVHSGGINFYLTGTSTVPLIGFWDEPHRSTYYDVENLGNPMFAHTGARHPQSPDPGIVPLGIKAKGQINFSTLYFRCHDTYRLTRSGTHYIAFTLLTNDTTLWQTANDRPLFNVEIEGSTIIDVRVDQGQIYSRWVRMNGGDEDVVRSTQKVPIPTGQWDTRVYVRWAPNESTNQLRATVTVGGNTTGDVYVHVLPANLGNRSTVGRVMVRDHYGIQDIIYAKNTATNAPDRPDLLNAVAPYCAVLDPGLLSLSHFPSVKSEDAWELIKEIAAAELGAAFWDEYGVFRFWNYNRIRNKRNQVVKTLTPDELSGLSMTRSLDSLRNEITVAKAKSVASSWRVIYEAGDADEFRVPPSGYKDFTIQQDNFIAADDSVMTRYRSSSTAPPDGLPTWNQYRKHGYVLQRYQTTAPAGWYEIDSSYGTSSTAVFTRVDKDGFLHFQIVNPYSNTIRFAFGEEEPAFRVGGSLKIDYDPAISNYRDEDSIAKYGARNLQIDNRWIQFGSPNYLFANYLSDRASRVVSVADQEIEAPGDPRIQLGDTILVRDEEGFGDEFKIQVTGITRTFTRDEGLTDSYSVEVFQVDD